MTLCLTLKFITCPESIDLTLNQVSFTSKLSNRISKIPNSTAGCGGAFTGLQYVA